MYRYDEFDAAFVHERVEQFRDQVTRRLSGELTEEEFKPLRLMNGVYLQLHAYMLRVAIPYGTLSSKQMRKLADISRRYDRNYGHFTTRQNIQFNWPALADCPDILAELASVEMHAIQTSGNCIRNVTADHFAGVAADEIADPRPYAELLRQWSSIHPEFSYLPRKFKIALSGADHDRAAIQVHDIGLQIVKSPEGELGFKVFVGGGLGRTPMIAHCLRNFIAVEDLLNYVDAILRVYNLDGRRDNKYKARIKILINEMGIEAFRSEVEHSFANTDRNLLKLPQSDVDAIIRYFTLPHLPAFKVDEDSIHKKTLTEADFAAFVKHNVAPHKNRFYGIVTLSLKPPGGIPGDASAEDMEAIADLAEEFSHSEIRVSHEQNLVLPFVARRDLIQLYDKLKAKGLAYANAGLISDIIACPGMDYCALATARSIPIAQQISDQFGRGAMAEKIGALKIKISGCINACGHHHVGHIGILGLERRGEETYQLTIGGSADENCALGTITGPGFAGEQVVQAVGTLIDTYLQLRLDADEDFLSAYRRLGMTPFKAALYFGDGHGVT